MLEKTLAYLHDNLGLMTRVEVNGSTFFQGPSTVVACPHPLAPRTCKTTVLGTLSGFAGAVVADIDSLDLGNTIATVTADRVELLGPLDAARQREIIWAAEYVSTWGDVVDQWIPLEKMVTLLDSRLDDRDGVVEEDAEEADDEQAGTGTGTKGALISKLSRVDVKEAVIQQRSGGAFAISTSKAIECDWESLGKLMLAPFRSFPEIEQVASRFVLEMKVTDPEPEKVTMVRIVPADGEAWRLEAAQRVEAVLRKSFSDLGDGPKPTIVG